MTTGEMKQDIAELFTTQIFTAATSAVDFMRSYNIDEADKLFKSPSHKEVLTKVFELFYDRCATEGGKITALAEFSDFLLKSGEDNLNGLFKHLLLQKCDVKQIRVVFVYVIASTVNDINDLFDKQRMEQLSEEARELVCKTIITYAHEMCIFFHVLEKKKDTPCSTTTTSESP